MWFQSMLMWSKKNQSWSGLVLKKKKKKGWEEIIKKKKKPGVFPGVYVFNPINNEKIPIWVADYVIGWYGTGAVMAVPAHDERDYEFAKKFDLPIKEVVKGGDYEKSAFE